MSKLVAAAEAAAVEAEDEARQLAEDLVEAEREAIRLRRHASAARGGAD
jgi:hypothetical protein